MASPTNSVTVATSSATAPTSKNLITLAGKINKEHDQIQALAVRGLRHARKAGEYLQQAKDQLGQHGKWGEWIEENCTLSQRTANLYMQIARHWKQIEQAKPDELDDLTINEAASLLKTRTRTTVEHTQSQDTTDSSSAGAGTTETMSTQSTESATAPVVPPDTNPVSISIAIMKQVEGIRRSVGQLERAVFGAGNATKPSAIDMIDRQQLVNRLAEVQINRV